MRLRPLAVCALLAFPSIAAADDLPLNPAVTQETVGTTICVIGWTKTIRPPAALTNREKRRLIRELELPEELLADFELDHRIPLALGGSPDDPRNLELQPWDEARKRRCRGLTVARSVRRHANLTRHHLGKNDGLTDQRPSRVLPSAPDAAARFDAFAPVG